MSSQKHVLCVATTRPSTSITPSGGGGSLTLLNPNGGSILNSLRPTGDLSGKAALGVASLSLFPKEFSTNSVQLVIAYALNPTKKGDTYAMLLSLRTASSSPPILHWKCRLPEAQLTAGLSVSPCGYYIIGGGESGNCFVWKTFGGDLLITFKAHYRPCTCLAWSDCGRYLLTGGADGMVHVFSLMDLVDTTYLLNNNNNSSNQSIVPYHTWSVHHLPISSMIHLAGGRIASASEDGQVVVMEVYSQTVLATLQFPHGIRCLAYHNGRLLAGSSRGVVYLVDLDAYSMHQTAKYGANPAKRRRYQDQEGQEMEESVFGFTSNDTTTGSSYQGELRGHDHPVTSMAIFVDDLQERLISGDEAGTLRIWDIESRTCLSIMKPWSQTSLGGATTTGPKDSSKQQKQQQRPHPHPVSTILSVEQALETADVALGPFATAQSANSTKNPSIVNMITPLQKYSPEEEAIRWTQIPLLKPKRTREMLHYWEAKCTNLPKEMRRENEANADLKLSTLPSADPKGGRESSLEKELESEREQVRQLQKQLEEQQDQVKRWEEVNNKLMAKLKAKR